MASNLTDIIAGIKTTLEDVAGIVNVYTYEPEKVGTTPAIVLHLASSQPLYPPRAPYGMLTIEWTFRCYLLFRDVSFRASEEDIATYVPAVIEALGQDLDAGEAILDGQVLVTRVTPGYYTVAAQRYHSAELTLTAVESVTYSYAL